MKWELGRCKEGKAEIFDADSGGVFARVSYSPEVDEQQTLAADSVAKKRINLILAAPELLAACRDLVYALNLHPTHPDWVSEDFKRSLLIEANNKVAEAISKAEGKP